MRRTLTAILATALLAGCGGGDEPAARATSTPRGTATPAETATATPAAGTASDADGKAVKAALRRYAAAVRAGDARTICRKLLATEVTEPIKQAGGSCERDLLGPRIEEAGPDYSIAVASISVLGDRATAQITATERDGPRETRQLLVRERGAWRLAVG